MRTVLVTGGAGFIGSHLCEALIARGDDVVVADNFDPLYARDCKLRNLAPLVDEPGLTLVEADIASRTDLNEIFERFSIEQVIHLAAKAGIRESMRDPAAYLKANVEGTANVLETMTRAGCRRLVFASSSSVYGNNPHAPFQEDDATNPISVYAMTKKAGEDLCHVYHRTHDVSAVCLRLFTVYGPRQRPGMAIHKFVRLMLDGSPVPIFGDGSLARDYTYVDDIVRGIVAGSDLAAEAKGFSTLNLGSGRPVSLEDLIALIGRILGRRAKVTHEAVPRVDVARTHADITRAGEMIGYRPEIDLEEGIRRFVTWYRTEAGLAPAPVG